MTDASDNTSDNAHERAGALPPHASRNAVRLRFAVLLALALALTGLLVLLFTPLTAGGQGSAVTALLAIVVFGGVVGAAFTAFMAGPWNLRTIAFASTTFPAACLAAALGLAPTAHSIDRSPPPVTAETAKTASVVRNYQATAGQTAGSILQAAGSLAAELADNGDRTSGTIERIEGLAAAAHEVTGSVRDLAEAAQAVSAIARGAPGQNSPSVTVKVTNADRPSQGVRIDHRDGDD